VDTASGTELAPGIKDPAKLRDFFAAVDRAAFAASAVESSEEPIVDTETLTGGTPPVGSAA
jgi:hypothetical protein